MALPPIVDCSQCPYISVGFSRPVCFDGAAAILVCKSERDLGRVSKLPRSWEAVGKIGTSHCLVFEGRAETLSPRLLESNKKYTP